MIDKMNQFAEKYQTYYTEEDRIKKQIKRLNKKIERLEYPSWVEEIIKPIAEALVKKMPNRSYSILGPFGLTCETSIHFYKNGKKNDCNDILSITFRPGELEKGEIKIIDHTIITNKYKAGTTGEMNGMNCSTIPMPETIDELFKYVS